MHRQTSGLLGENKVAFKGPLFPVFFFLSSSTSFYFLVIKEVIIFSHQHLAVPKG